MTLEQLRALVAVVDSGSARKAASILGKSQPALSALLKRLEKSVGGSLFYKQSSHLKLTASGEQLYEKAQELISIQSKVDKFVNLNSIAPVTIAFDYAMPQQACALLNESLIKQFPLRQFTLLRGDSQYIRQLLLKGDIDLAIMRPPSYGVTGYQEIHFDIASYSLVSHLHKNNYYLLQSHDEQAMFNELEHPTGIPRYWFNQPSLMLNAMHSLGGYGWVADEDITTRSFKHLGQHHQLLLSLFYPEQSQQLKEVTDYLIRKCK